MVEERRITVDEYGNPLLDTEEGKLALLYGNDIERCFFTNEEEIEKFNSYSEKVLGKELQIFHTEEKNIDAEEYHAKRASVWYIPDEYKKIDVKKYLLDKCQTETEIERVEEEYRLFEEKSLIPLLQFLIFIVDYMREKKLVWGVGRGSSVASYCLYLIGIHKVNSIKYNLPIEEFLK